MTQFANYTDTLLAQKKKASELFGFTAIPLPGTKPEAGMFYPNMSQAFLVELLPFWVAEVDRALDAMGAIPDSAISDQWVDAEFKRLKPLNQRIKGLAPTKTLIPPKLAQVTWDILDDVVLPMKILVDTPTKWDFLVESVKESAKDLLHKGEDTLIFLAKVGLGILGAGVAYNIIVNRPSKG